MSFNYYRSITIDHTKCGTVDSTDFPALIHISDATLKTVGNGGHVQNASGFDVTFYADSAGTTPLFWEMLSYDGAAGVVWAFVRIPTLSHTTDTVIYTFYGNPSISTFQSTVATVWSANFVRVMHLSEAAHPYLDSTSNAYDSTSTVDPTQVSGLFNKAQSFVAASTQVITGMTQPTNIGGQGTYSGWFNSSNTTGGQAVIDGRGNVSHFGGVLYANANVPSFYTNNIGPIVGSSGICNGAWRYLLATYNVGTSMELYVDGASVASTGNCGLYQAGNTAVGVSTDASPGAYMDGLLQEIRQSTVKQSTSWITSDYNNQSAPDTFITVGSENSLITGGIFRIATNLSGIGTGGPFFTNPLN